MSDNKERLSVYGINLCNPSLELNQADKTKLSYSCKKVLAKDNYTVMDPKFIPRVVMLETWKDKSSALESRVRNELSFSSRQVEALVNRKLKGAVA